MHRRHFHSLLGITLASRLVERCSAQDATPTPTSKSGQVIVVGTGLAGLAAAQKLKSHGLNVIVLEARDRIGGRIWTSHKWPQIPLDLGASWIHGVDGNPLTELADHMDARRSVTSYENARIYNTQGRPLSSADELRLEKLRARILQRLRAAQDSERDLSVRDAIDPLMQEWKPSTEEHRWAQFVLNSELEQEYSGSLSRLSTHWYDSVEEFDGEDELFHRGFQVIPEHLKQGLMIELGQVVREIDWRESPVRIRTQRSEFTADQVLVTLPLGVLKSRKVKFSPDLPADKQQAIHHLGMGVLNKCYLQFKEPFWPEDVDWLEYIPAQPGYWTEWVSFQHAAKQPVLLGFTAADAALEIEKLSDRDVVASAMKTLKTIFGRDIPEPVDYQLTRWAQDPFALGSYSFNAIGSTPPMRDELAAPVDDRLFFAGEASHRGYFATAHGAYLSGLRAAAEMLDA